MLDPLKLLVIVVIARHLVIGGRTQIPKVADETLRSLTRDSGGFPLRWYSFRGAGQYKGPPNSQEYDSEYHAWETINGDPNNDQPIFARYHWLTTDQNVGTNWGPAYMPYTLNHWRNVNWYVQDGISPPPYGNNLTQSRAWVDIAYDVYPTNKYPIAENVEYGWVSYFPNYWPQTQNYQHWDTIYGNDNNSVQIAQSYPYWGQRAAYYSEPWNTQWTAIAANQGLVW